MRWWRPEPGAPELLDWYRPLLEVARQALDDEFPWCVHVQDFRVVGRVRRERRPDIWVYACGPSGRELYVDVHAQTYKFIPTPNGRGVGRFRLLELRSALWRCGVPDVIRPAWRPPVRHDDDEWDLSVTGPPDLRVVR
jgi:hypothetical protein